MVFGIRTNSPPKPNGSCEPNPATSTYENTMSSSTSRPNLNSQGRVLSEMTLRIANTVPQRLIPEDLQSITTSAFDQANDDISCVFPNYYESNGSEDDDDDEEEEEEEGYEDEEEEGNRRDFKKDGILQTMNRSSTWDESSSQMGQVSKTSLPTCNHSKRRFASGNGTSGVASIFRLGRRQSANNNFLSAKVSEMCAITNSQSFDENTMDIDEDNIFNCDERRFGNKRKQIQAVDSTTSSSNERGIRTCTSYDDYHRRDMGAIQKEKDNHDAAVAHLERKEWDEALILFQEILRSHEEKYGAQHQYVGAALHNVGVVYFRAGKYEKSIPFFKQAVGIRKSVLKKNHPDLVMSQLKLGTTYSKLKQTEPALENLTLALKSRRIALGCDHPKVAEVLCHIGCVYFEIGELLAALSSFYEAMDIQKGAMMMVPKHEKRDCVEKLAEIIGNIGCIRSKRKQYAEAIVAYKEACKLLQSIFGDNHRSVIATVDSMAFAYQKSGNTDKCLKLYRKILHSQRCNNNANQNDYISTLSKISLVYEKQKNYEEALEYTREILQIKQDKLDENHPEVYSTKKTLLRLEHSLRDADSRKGLF